MANQASTTPTFRGVLGGGAWFNEDSGLLVRRAFELCGTSPRFLVMPTPLSSLPCPELDGIRDIFGTELGPDHFRTLTKDTQAMPDPVKAEDDLGWANVVLIMGGNFAEVMLRWKNTGIDKLLLATQDVVFVGASTGFICWSRAAQTRNQPLGQGDAPTDHLQDGLGVLPVLTCAHLDNDQSGPNGRRIPRLTAFQDLIDGQPTGTVGIGVKNFGYIEVDGDTVTVGKTNRYANVHRIESTDSGINNVQFGSGDTAPYAEFFGAS